MVEQPVVPLMGAVSGGRGVREKFLNGGMEMEFELAMRRSTFIGFAVGGIHLAVVSYFALVIEHNSLPWIWMIFAFIDFPVSLFTLAGLDAMMYAWGDVAWEEPWKQFMYASWPIFVHAVLGSVWWGLACKYFVRFFTKHDKTSV